MEWLHFKNFRRLQEILTSVDSNRKIGDRRALTYMWQLAYGISD